MDAFGVDHDLYYFLVAVQTDHIQVVEDLQAFGPVLVEFVYELLQVYLGLFDFEDFPLDDNFLRVEHSVLVETLHQH